MELVGHLVKAFSTLTKKRKRDDHTLPSSSFAPPISPAFKIRPTKINESLYEFREQKPPVAPNMVILFFHGFYSTDFPDTWLETWESEDKSCIWPSTWLAQKFPGARILYVSYSAILGKSSRGNPDMHILGENLASDVLQEDIGQTPNCPVILVGHCFGGLVIKQLCLHISNDSNLIGLESTERIRRENFLSRIKGVFYYGTPHRGTPCVEEATHLDDPLLQYFKVLNKNASRLNDQFSRLCKVHKWKIKGLGESLRTDQGFFHGVIAPEACSRDGDEFNVVSADHISISKPQSDVDRRFYALTSLVDSILRDFEVEAPGHQCQGLPDRAVMLEKLAQEVQVRLSENVVLGICGMGGIGKTTLARTVYNFISKEYEYTCFLDNVKGTQSGLEARVLSHFHKNGRSVERIQWKNLMGKKTLIVMDDIDSEDQLHVLPKLGHFGNGSNIVITTRDKEVLKAYENYGVYDVEFLKETEAKKLFCLNAFGVEDLSTHGTQSNLLNENVMKVVQACGGLPLTLEVMGRYLRKKEDNPNIWEQTIDRLRKAESITGSRNDRVWASLRVSYDALVEEEQEMFIEAGTLFFERGLGEALAGWSTTISNSESRWANLVSRSMVKVVFTEDIWSRLNFGHAGKMFRKTVWVHEQLRDLARSLAKNKIKMGSDEVVAAWNENEMREETKGLRLRYNSIPVSLDSLGKLEKLRYLYMDQVHYQEGESDQKFPCKLSILEWSGSPLIRPMLSITLNEMKNLAVLQLSYTDIAQRSFEGLGNLSNLCVLTLKAVTGLHRLPQNFGNLRRLKDLHLEDLRLERLPESLGNLSALENLILVEVDCVELPDSFGNLSSLVTLDINNCPRLSGLPLSFGDNLKSLKNASIESCPLLDRLPESFSQLSGLQVFKLYRCAGMTQLCDSFGNLSALRYLSLTCPGINKLPANFWRLSTLKELTIYELNEMTMLPDDIGQLTALTILHIESNSLATLPESIGVLSSLERLTIRCRKLERLPQSLGELTRLQELTLEVPCVRTLPDALGDLPRLGVDSVWFPSLRKLTLADCANLEKLPDQLGDLSLLKELSISAPSVKNLPESIGRLRSLRKLTLADCANLEKLPDQLGDLSLLEELSISAPSVKNLPESIGRLRSLRKLTLSAKRMSLPKTMGQLSSLRKLVLECDGCERLPDCLDYLPSSDLALELTGAKTRTLPEGLSDFSSLRDLTLKLRSLESLPEELGKLSSLRKLSIRCWKIECLPDSLGQIKSLSEMNLYACHRLKTLPDSLGRASSSQVATSQGGRWNDLMNQSDLLEEPSSNSTELKGMRLSIRFCDYLSDPQMMRRLGWVMVRAGDAFGQEEHYPWREYYRKGNGLDC